MIDLSDFDLALLRCALETEARNAGGETYQNVCLALKARIIAELQQREAGKDDDAGRT